MPGPWERYQQPAAKPWERYATAQPREFVGPPVPSAMDRVRSAISRVGTKPDVDPGVNRGLGRFARMGAEAVGALPLMAADAGVAGRNLATGSQYELPSQMYQRGLDAVGLPRPQGMAEKVVDVVGQAVMGSRLPVPQVNNPAPANFVPPARQALASARQSGYVVPPATGRPDSTAAGIAEGAAGKLTTAQRAAALNQPNTNRLAAQAVGITDDGAVTPAVLDTIRSEAGKAHEAIRSFAKPIVSDTQYRVELANATRSLQNVANKFPSLAQKDVLAIADDLAQPRFDADSAVDAISMLRDKASVAYRNGDPGLGKAYRSMSNAFENLVERRLEQGGSGDLVKNFRAARELIAKTYSVQNALKGENVDAQALARALDRGKYLSGTLRQIAQFAQRFPKAARVVPATESLPAYSPLDYLSMGASLAGGAISGNPSALIPFAYSAARPAVRNFLLSPAGQKLMIEGVPTTALGPAVNAAIPAANALNRERAPLNR